MEELRERVAERVCWEDAPGTVWDPKAATVCRKSGGGEGLSRLVRASEGGIVPRLLLPQRAAAGNRGAASARGRVPGSEEIAELASLILVHDAAIACSYVASLRERGVPVESIYLDLLAPTARRLGDLWD